MLIFDNLEDFEVAEKLIHKLFKEAESGYTAGSWQSSPKINGTQFGLMLPQKGILKSLFADVLKDGYRANFKVINRTDTGWFPQE